MNCNYHTLRLYELGSTTGCNSIFDCGSNLCKWQPTHFRFSNCNSAIFFCVHKFIHSFITTKWRAIVQFVVVKYYVLYYRYWWYWVLSVWRLVYAVGLSAGDCLSVCLAGSFWWSIHLCNVKNACVSGFRVVGQNIYFGVLLFEHTYFVVLHAVGQ